MCPDSPMLSSHLWADVSSANKHASDMDVRYLNCALRQGWWGVVPERPRLYQCWAAVSGAPPKVHGSKIYMISVCMQALQNPEHVAGPADAWCCGAILYMLLGGAFPFLTAREAELGPMRQLHALVQRIVSGRFLDLSRSVSTSAILRVQSVPLAGTRQHTPIGGPSG
jgi:hypothetical protein